MTFHESYGSLPTNLLRTYKRANVSPADHDSILAAFGKSWNDVDIPWSDVVEYVSLHIRDGIFRPGRYSL